MSPSNRDQIEELRKRVAALEERSGVSKSEETKTSDKPATPVTQPNKRWIWIKDNRAWLFPTAAILIAVTGWFASPLFKTHLDHQDDVFNRAVDDRIKLQLEPVSKSISEMGIKIARIEGEMQVLLAGKAISSITFYAKRGDVKNAEKYADDAHVALVSAIQAKTPATPDYFEMQVATLNASSGAEKALREKIQTIRTDLAAYRSVFTPEPKRPERIISQDQPAILNSPSPGDTVFKFDPMEHAARIFPNFKVIGGIGSTWFDVRNVTGSAFEVGTSRNPVANRPYIQGPVIWGGKQTLDGIDWVDVTFVDMHISYDGGYLSLRGVKFVNCTFDAPPTKNGAQFVDYAALAKPSLNIS